MINIWIDNNTNLIMKMDKPYNETTILFLFEEFTRLVLQLTRHVILTQFTFFPEPFCCCPVWEILPIIWLCKLPRLCEAGSKL